jgi:phosphatidylserine/phosphatidylglycerophosphate/cardiolipin synthase-like enzyme
MKKMTKWLIIGMAFSLLFGMWGCGSQPPKAPEKPKVETSAVKAANSPMPASINKPTTIKAAGTIEVAFSPKGGGADAIIKAIGEAKKTIRVQAYSFTNADIAKALLDASKKGVDVKVVLDSSQETEKYSSATFLDNNKIPLRIDHDFAIAHSKVMIIDEENVITGSFNFTKAAEERNGENVLILRGNKELAALYLKNWQWRWDASAAYKRPAGQ